MVGSILKIDGSFGLFKIIATFSPPQKPPNGFLVVGDAPRYPLHGGRGSVHLHFAYLGMPVGQLELAQPQLPSTLRGGRCLCEQATWKACPARGQAQTNQGPNKPMSQQPTLHSRPSQNSDQSKFSRSPQRVGRIPSPIGGGHAQPNGRNQPYERQLTTFPNTPFLKSHCRLPSLRCPFSTVIASSFD